MRVLVFEGQGSSSFPSGATAPSVPSKANASAASLPGKLFLQECNAAFKARISAFTDADIARTGVSIDALKQVSLPVPEDQRASDPLVSIPSLYVQQVLRVLELLETHPQLFNSERPEDALHILGYSSGLLPALFVATTFPMSPEAQSSALVQRAMAIFEIALSLGVHSQFSRQDIWNASGKALDDPAREIDCWSTVVLGPERAELVTLIDEYNAIAANQASQGVHITAQTLGTCHTVSGVPDAVRAFSSYIASNAKGGKFVSSKPLNVCSLFHVDVAQLHTVRDNVLQELPPSANDLKINDSFSLYDTLSGSPISGSSIAGPELVSRVVDLIMTKRVEFTAVVESVVASATPGTEPEILNLGPGSGISSVVARALKVPAGKVVDLSPGPRITQPAHVSNDEDDRIAIVGMAAQFPGARNADELWTLIVQGVNTLEEIPENRFDMSPYVGSPPTYNAKVMKTRTGNFLPDNLHATFDNAFFKISPKEAANCDPQMRVAIRVGFQALEAAGVVVRDATTDASQDGEGVIGTDDIGCYLGIGTTDYYLNLRNDVGVHYVPGVLPAFLAGRVAYALHLSGPAMVQNTACSSSMVAVQMACRALLAGDCKAALTGGVNIFTSPDMFIGLDRAHFLSPDQNCRPWDVSANGYSRAEGCGMFVFKRYAQAIADNDNILGVIRSSEVNQSSEAVSITRPHGPTLEKLFSMVVQNARVRPEDVSVVEAHGTGTQAGDPTELGGLRSVLSPGKGRGRDESNPLHVMSIKANIGHAEPASGSASLAKLMMMFRHGLIPPQIGLETLNPKIEDLSVDHTRINTSGKCLPWTRIDGKPRMALVNNFGAAGSNAAILLEEPPVRSYPAAFSSSSTDVIVGLSAQNKEAAIRLRDLYVAHLSGLKDAEALVDFAYTASARRQLRPWRLAVVGSSANALAQQLAKVQPSEVEASKDNAQKRVVFVFSGQGGQHLGMGQELYRASSTFKSVVDKCHAKLVSWGYPGVFPVITPSAKDNLDAKETVVAFQCAIYVLECALAQLWISWGVKPDAVVGHSLGEYAALFAAGVFSLDAGLRLVAHRARLMSEKCKQNFTGMLAARQSADIVAEIINKSSELKDLSLACLNGPKDVVVGGPLDQLNVLKTSLDLNGVKGIVVDVPFGYHTQAMEPILDDFVSYARKVDFKAPRIPVISNVTGGVVQPGDSSIFNAEYVVQHCRQPVRFEQGVRNLLNEKSFAADGIGAWIEIGPHPTSLPMLSPLTSSSSALSLASLNKKSTALASLFGSLSRLYANRLASVIHWGRVYRELQPSSRAAEIPFYPLQEKEYWVSYRDEPLEASIAPAPAVPDSAELAKYKFLGSWIQRPSSVDGNVSVFDTPMDAFADYITGHSVGPYPLCPASVYHEVALSAATCTLEASGSSFDEDLLTLVDLRFTHPLVYNKDIPMVMRTTINLHPDGAKHVGSFTISSVLDGKELNIHSKGFIGRKSKSGLESKLQMHKSMIQRGINALLNPPKGSKHETVCTRTLYEVIFARVVRYSELYQIVSSITVDEKLGECIGFLQMPASQKNPGEGFIDQPIFIDAVAHVAGYLINRLVPDGEAFICGHIDSMKVLTDLDYNAPYEVFCTSSMESKNLAVGEAWAVQCDENGGRKLVAHMRGIRFNRLRLSGLTKVLAYAVDSVTGGTTVSPPQDLFSEKVVRVVSAPEHSPLASKSVPASSGTPTVVNVSPAVEVDVVKFVSELCGVPTDEITVESVLADLGVDSLIWLELIGMLKDASSGLEDIDGSLLMESETIGDLMKHVVGKTAASIPKELPRPQKIVDEPVKAAHTKSSPDSSQMRAKVAAIVSDILGVATEDLKDADRLEDLGMDSIGSIEAMHAIQSLLPSNISLPSELLQTQESFGALVSYLISILPSAPAAAPPKAAKKEVVHHDTEAPPTIPKNFLQLQTSSRPGAPPIFLIHDGSGLANCYARIGPLNHTLWGISNPLFASGGKWEGGIPELVQYYQGQVTPLASTDAGCVLGGWSFGGVVAFNLACEIIKAGGKVAGVVLIDSPSPFTRQALPEEVLDSVVEAIGAASPTGGSDAINQKRAEIARYTQIAMRHSTNDLVTYDPLQQPAISSVLASGKVPPVVMLRCIEPFSVPGVRRDSFLEDRGTNDAPIVRDWERLVGKPIPIIDLPGHHFEVFQSQSVQGTTEQLINALKMIQNGGVF